MDAARNCDVKLLCNAVLVPAYMVQGGLGIAILPSEKFRSRTIEGVTEVRITDEIIKTVGIAWRRDTSSPIVHTITNFASRWKQPE